jgi:hypothetical protein
LDSFLIDDLRSGNAWLLVGSGPSTAMGYPTWRGLAEAADKLVAREHGRDKELAAALAARDSHESLSAYARWLSKRCSLKTIIPSRKATKEYLGEESDHED